MLKEFRAFILRGNVVDLAVGVVVGAAFGAVVTAFVANIITPLIAAIFGKPSFGNLYFTINGSQIRYGSFINAVISFLLIAAAVFFFVVVPVNRLMAARKTEPDPEAETRNCPQCLSKIPVLANRCAFCTADIGPATA